MSQKTCYTNCCIMKKIILLVSLLFCLHVFAQDSTLAGDDLKNPKTGGKLIALTFDDGPNTKATPKVLAVCKKYQIPVTFFVVGRNLNGKARKIAAQAVKEGHEIENHTWAHPHMTELTSEERIEQIKKTNAAIKSITKKEPKYFRPPYIDYDAEVLKDVDMVFITGLGSDDWVVENTPDKIHETVMKKARDGAIIVMHDFVYNKRTPVALEKIIPELLTNGYRFVTVDQLFTERHKKVQKHSIYNGSFAYGKKKKRRK